MAALVGVHVGEWQDTLGLPDDEWETSPFLQMAVEHALHTDGTGEEPYLSFADNPGTPLELAATARDCAEAVYGLWQVREPVPGPGLRLTDLVRGAERYVMFAPEGHRLAPWAVLLGAIAPVDGIWRTMVSMVQLSPDEGDRCVDRVLETADALITDLAVDAGRKPRPTSLLNQVGEPHGIFVDRVSPVEPDLATVVSTVTGILLPPLVAGIQAARETPPEMRNTDGHPVTLVVATISLTD